MACIAVCLLAALDSAASARGGAFQVQACSGAPGNANHSWIEFNRSPAYLRTSNDCGAPGGAMAGGGAGTSGLSASDAVGFSGGVPAGTTAGWLFTAPTGATITAAVLDRDLYKRGDNTWLVFVSDQSKTFVPGQDCTIDPGIANHCETSGVLSLGGLSDTSLAIGVLCSGGCVNGAFAHNVRADLDHATVTLSDVAPPAPPTATGPLTQTSWHAGSASLSVSSSDPVGISQIQVRSPTGVVLAGTAQSCDYTYPVPCPQADGVSVQVNTLGLPDGILPLTLVATDTAQNSATSTIQVMVANHPPAPPLALTATAAPGGPIVARWIDPVQAVPLTTASWQLCTRDAACAPVTTGADAHALSIPAGPGSYRLRLWLGDAAGHSDLRQAAEASVTVPSRPGPAGTGGAGTATLPPGPNASLTLPASVGPSHLRLLLRLRRRPHRRLELDLRTKPRRPGHLVVGLVFDNRPAQRRTLHLRGGAAALLVPVPHLATRLNLTVRGFGARFTAEVRLAP